MFRSLLIIVFSISIAALSTAQNGKPLVLSTASMIHDMALNIGGDYFTYEMIVPIGGDPHIYEPTPRDAHICYDSRPHSQEWSDFRGMVEQID